MSIVKKDIIDGNKTRCIIKSSNILESIYDSNSKELTLTFKNGRRYKYTGVMKEIYSGFEKADSNGKYFNQYIKHLTTTRLDDINISSML